MVNTGCALLAIVCIASSLTIGHARGVQSVAIRFPGPANIKALPSSVLQRQKAAPYPPAGIQPNPPFELPTEEAADFPNEPDLTYGPPADVQISSNLPQSASILQSNVIYPRTKLTLPSPQRLTLFRPIRQPNRRVKPAKIIVGAPLKLPKGILAPITQLVPPLVERFNVFKQNKKVIVGGLLKPGGLAAIKPTITSLLTPLTDLVPPLVERFNVFKRTKKTAVVGLLNPAGLAAKPPLSTILAQLTPAIKKPVVVGGRIIGYSDRPQNW